MKSLFSKEFEPSCGFCANGQPTSGGDKILCRHKGVVDNTFHCQKFKYDPLKRVPHHAPKLPQFDKKDFSL